MAKKNWYLAEVPELVTKIYKKVLERDWDPEGLIAWGSCLDRGEKTVREVVRGCALSQEHTERFIEGSTPEDGVKTCYRHILNREADPEGLAQWTDVFVQEGIDDVIKGRPFLEEFAYFLVLYPVYCACC